MNWEELYQYVEECGELPDESCCEECGFPPITEDQAHELEYVLYCGGEFHGMILIDVCLCPGSPAYQEEL